MTKAKSHYPFCIYTIVHAEKLAEWVEAGGTATFPEKKVWTTGRALLTDAEATGQEMPILFGDAADCSELIYWAFLVDIKITGEETTYSVKQLTAFKKVHRPQELVLRSTGKHIKPDFIRPYAICHTPRFLPT